MYIRLVQVRAPHFYTSQAFNHISALPDPLGNGGKRRVFNRSHRSDGIDDRHFNQTIRLLLDSNIARQHGSNFVFQLECLIGERRIAAA